jgi:GNAT superfamily N-acetyltransferase
MLFPQVKQPPLRPGPPLHSVKLEPFLEAHGLVPNQARAERYLEALLPSQIHEGDEMLASERPRLSLHLRHDLHEYRLFLFPPYGCAEAELLVSFFGHTAGRTRALGLMVAPFHRGQGIATDMLLAAYATGVKSIETPYPVSIGGRASLAAAHREAVCRALKQGIEVSQAVLASYPEFDQQAAPEL